MFTPSPPLKISTKHRTPDRHNGQTKKNKWTCVFFVNLFAYLFVSLTEFDTYRTGVEASASTLCFAVLYLSIYTCTSITDWSCSRWYWAGDATKSHGKWCTQRPRWRCIRPSGPSTDTWRNHCGTWKTSRRSGSAVTHHHHHHHQLSSCTIETQ